MKFVCLLLTLIQTNTIFAQPTVEKTTTRGSSEISAQEKTGIEKEYLRKAKHNIEKYRKGEVSLLITDTGGKPLSNVQVEINQESQDFLFGNLCEEVFRPGISKEDVIKFREKFKALFNFTELTIKWEPYESEQGKPQWQKLQEKLDWCRANNITPKGHTLGWTHEAGTPSWLLKLPPLQATGLYKARIQNLVGGFKDQLKMWDVVNEPVTTIPWEKALQDTISKDGKIDEGIRYNVNGITLEETLPVEDDGLMMLTLTAILC
ncbi:MAG: endo-1,4-beta-xylanase [Ferruginibacter sp.]